MDSLKQTEDYIMCQSCPTTIPSDSGINIEEAMMKFRKNLDDVIRLQSVQEKLSPRDQSFAQDLVRQFRESNTLSANQFHWVRELTSRVQVITKLEGDFNTILVMFRFAAADGKIKIPRIRLMTEGGKFIRLTFKNIRISDGTTSRIIEIHQGGWANHGRRFFVGQIKENSVVPYRDRVDDDILELLKAFSLDPMKVARASANLIGACSFCGLQLTRAKSKHYGYGADCAKNYGLEWDHDLVIEESKHRDGK